MKTRTGKRISLRDYEAGELAEGLDLLFERVVEVPRMKAGRKQTLETLIEEEASLFAMFLRNERDAWFPEYLRSSAR